MGGKVCNSAVAGAGVGAGGGSGRVSEIMRPCLGVGTKYLARQEKSVLETAAFLPQAEVIS